MSKVAALLKIVIFALVVVVSPCSAVSPKVVAFYYPWYHSMAIDGNWDHWEDSIHTVPDNISAAFYPQLGTYSANDPVAVHQHMKWLRDAGVGVISTSWWGIGSDSDESVAQLLDIGNMYGIKVAFHIEPFGGRTAYTAKDAVIYCIDTYGTHPAVFRDSGLGNRMVFFFFASNEIPDAQWAVNWDSIRGTAHDAIVIGDCFDHNRILAGHWDGFYNYFPGQEYTNWNSHASWAQSNNKFMAPPVGVGWNTSAIGGYGPPTIERNRGEYCDTTWNAACNAAKNYSSVRYIGITSFNEWHEGTQIEPAVPTSFPEGRTYLDYLPDGPTMFIDKTASWAAVFDPANSGKIQCEDYSGGTGATEGVDYHDTTSGNAGGAYRSHGVDIQACGEGGYNVGWVAAGEWLRYTGVQISWSGRTEIRLRVAGWQPPRQVHFCDGSLSNTILTLTVPVTGGFQNWTTISGIVTLSQGSHTIYLVADEVDVNFNWFELRPVDVVAPFAPSNPGMTNQAPGSFRFTWQDNSSDETGFSVYADPGTYGPTTVYTAAANAGYWDYTGLTPNTRYCFEVAAANDAGESRRTTVQTYCTLSAAPSLGNNLVCDRSIGVTYPLGTIFTFSNPAGFGLGTHGGNQYRLTRYFWVWNKNPTYTFTGSGENFWQTGNRPLSCSQGDGAYYLHLRSHNYFNTPNPVTLDYGPFYYDGTRPVTSASPVGGVYSVVGEGFLPVTLTASETATIYYTTDGSQPTTQSAVYAGPLQLSADTTLRYFAVDAVGNTELTVKQSTYYILQENGSIAALKALPHGSQVRLGDKALYLKQTTFAYIQDPRPQSGAGPQSYSGIRLQGSVNANEGDLVCTIGSLQKPIGGEPYVQVTAATSHGEHSTSRVALNNRAAKTDIVSGLWVMVWGVVQPGSIIGNSYIVVDGADGTGVKIITPTAPNVTEGQFVIVTGAAGFDGQRVVYASGF